MYPRSRGSRTCACRPSGADSLRRRDRPWDAVVVGAVRHPALERQQRCRTWAGHHEERAPNRHDAVALRPLPRQEALRDASKLPAPAVDRRQLRAAGHGQRREPRRAPTARGDAALAAAWLCRTRPTRRSEAAPVARCGEPAGRRAAKKWPGKRPKRPVGRGRCWLAQHERVLTAHAGSRQRSIPRTATCRLFWLFASRRRFSVNRNG